MITFDTAIKLQSTHRVFDVATCGQGRETKLALHGLIAKHCLRPQGSI